MAEYSNIVHRQFWLCGHFHKFPYTKVFSQLGIFILERRIVKRIFDSQPSYLGFSWDSGL